MADRRHSPPPWPSEARTEDVFPVPRSPLEIPDYCQAVKTWLESTPCTISELARRANVTRSRLSEFVNKSPDIKLSTLKRLYKAMREIQADR